MTTESDVDAVMCQYTMLYRASNETTGTELNVSISRAPLKQFPIDLPFEGLQVPGSFKPTLHSLLA